MSYGGGAAGGAAGAAAVAAAIANAIKASGAIVSLEPKDFVSIVERCDKPLVVFSPKGFLSSNKYLTSYRGLFFFCKTAEPLRLPSDAEIILSKKIWVPG